MRKKKPEKVKAVKVAIVESLIEGCWRAGAARAAAAEADEAA